MYFDSMNIYFTRLVSNYLNQMQRLTVYTAEDVQTSVFKSIRTAFKCQHISSLLLKCAMLCGITEIIHINTLEFPTGWFSGTRTNISRWRLTLQPPPKKHPRTNTVAWECALPFCHGSSVWREKHRSIKRVVRKLSTVLLPWIKLWKPATRPYLLKVGETFFS